MTHLKTHWKKDILLFLTSQTISLFGSSLVQYAIMWYITLQTQSGLMMTISIICGFLPTFFLAPFAGVWADRYDRKKLIMLSDSMIALSTLGVAMLFLSGHDAMWLLFVVSAIRAVGAAVQMPSVGAFVPQIVPEEKLTKVNGINSSVQSVIMLLSPMVSGALLSMTTIEVIFFIDVVTAAMAVLTLLFFLKVPPHEKALSGSGLGYVADLVSGFSYIKNHAYVRAFFTFCAIFFFLAAPAAFLTPLQVARTFGSDVWRLTAIEISFSVGMMFGGLLMAYWGGFNNRAKTMAASSFVMSLCTLALGVIPNFWLYLGFMGLFGVAMPMFNTPSTVLLQETVEPDYMGRVFGVLAMISSSMMPMGMLVFGPLSDVFPIEGMLVFTGILLLVQSYFMAKNKALIQAGHPKEAAEN